MAKENEAGHLAGGHKNQAQAANTATPAYDLMRAVQEAAHVVVIDDLGYRVTLVNIKVGEPQLIKVEW
jgi:hypothetical protein